MRAAGLDVQSFMPLLFLVPCRDDNDYGWPAPRVVLQLQLFAALWPLSDKVGPLLSAHAPPASMGLAFRRLHRLVQVSQRVLIRLSSPCRATRCQRR